MPGQSLLRISALAAASLFVSTSNAGELASAQRAHEIAVIELQLYTQVEHPAERRRLRSAITIAEAEVESLRRQLRGLRSFTRIEPADGAPLTSDIEQFKLQLLAAELRVKDLRAQRSAETKSHAARVRLMQLRVEQAAARVAASRAALNRR